MLYNKWLTLWHRFHVLIGRKFESWGIFVFNRPKLIIILPLIVTAILAGGFFSFDIYGQTERIFYPQNSDTFKELNRAEKYFNYYVQNEEFILLSKTKDENVIRREFFLEALQMHRYIMNISRLEEFCIKNTKGECLSISPLELFDYDARKLVNVDKVLLKYIQNDTHILSSGYNTKMSIPRWFGSVKIDKSRGSITAKALRVEYPVKFGKHREDYERNKKWEKKLLKYFEDQKKDLRMRNMTLIFNAVRSDDDSVEKNTEENILLIMVSIGSMVLFCGVCMIHYKDFVKGHFLISLVGIFCVTLGIGCGFGLSLYLNIPYVGFVGVLPFLILGVGIDDMFIILTNLDQLPPEIKGSERLGKAMKRSGFSITMTTLTDLVAFVIGTVSLFPAVRIFCIFAFFSLLFAYLMIITLFLAFLSYEVKRIENSKLDCMPWRTKANSESEDKEKIWESNEGDTISMKLMRMYAQTLMKLPSKIIVILFAALLFAVGIYGTINTSFDFDYKIVGSDQSNFVKWITTMDTHFPVAQSLYVDVILDDVNADYSSKTVQQQFVKFDKLIKENEFYEDKSANWMLGYLMFEKHANITQATFIQKVHMFLKLYPMFKRDIIFSGDGQKILASRIHVMTKKSLDWIYRKDAMLSIRKDLKSKVQLDFYPACFMFIYASHLVVILQSTLTNIAICCAVILLITLPYVIRPSVSLLLLLCFGSFIVDLLGIMHFWGLSLNSITMIVMVMAIGFSVDYSCHVTHAYITSSQSNPNMRMIEALSSIGFSVLKGGLSTLVGIIVLAFSDSKLFVLFFKMMFSIIVLGLVHGLVILPVLLTLICRSSNQTDTDSKNKSEENGVKNHDGAKGALLKDTNI